MVEIFNYPEENEKEENVCYSQDTVCYYEENGKYGNDVVADNTLESQDKLETFLDKYPLWSIKDWRCIPFLDKKKIPYFFDHPEVFEVVDENIKYDENDGIIKQDYDIIHTHTVVCLHVYVTEYEDINNLREDIIDWVSEYPDISKVSIIECGSWYHEDCSLVIIEQRQKNPTVSIYNYYEPAETFLY